MYSKATPRCCEREVGRLRSAQSSTVEPLTSPQSVKRSVENGARLCRNVGWNGCVA